MTYCAQKSSRAWSRRQAQRAVKGFTLPVAAPEDPEIVVCVYQHRRAEIDKALAGCRIAAHEGDKILRGLERCLHIIDLNPARTAHCNAFKLFRTQDSAYSAPAKRPAAHDHRSEPNHALSRRADNRALDRFITDIDLDEFMRAVGHFTPQMRCTAQLSSRIADKKIDRLFARALNHYAVIARELELRGEAAAGR